VDNSRKVLASWLAAVFQLAQIPAGLLQITRFAVCMVPNSNELIMIFFLMILSGVFLTGKMRTIKLTKEAPCISFTHPHYTLYLQNSVQLSPVPTW